jgi:BirA family biotin operon repressor/biotin-[acetyl-CoA-carboxylase] ligase
MTDRVETARRLRRDLTDAERSLWSRLRRNALGVHFKRQVPLGLYIADFCCLQLRLIVEADGGQHGGLDDDKRDAFLMSQGYRVLRFWNNDILDNVEGVLSTIKQALEATPSPPSPASGRGGLQPSVR